MIENFSKLFEPKNNKVWIYDIEIYPNFFCVDFFNGVSHEQFEISSRKNQIEEIVNFIKKKITVVGYNNQRFDDLVIFYILNNKDMLIKYPAESIANKLFEIGGRTIDYYQKHSKDETIKELAYWKKPFDSVDLMRTAALQKGLKLVGVSLKWNNIQDLPFPWDEPLDSDSKIDIVMEYNKNDTDMTYALAMKLKPQLLLRVALSEKYQEDLLSSSDSQIGNILFEKRYDEKINKYVNDNPELPKEVRERLLDFRNGRTHRKSIALSEVIVPTIKFETRSLNRLLSSLKLQTLYKGESGFRLDIPVFEFKGQEYQMGIGGLHSNDKPKVFEYNEEYFGIDSDVTSFYPNMMIKDNIYPDHLVGELYIECMREFTLERIEAKKSGDKVKADSGKITVNSAFGKLGFEGSWSYDDQAMIQVTLNGQLYLLMLIEQLSIKGFEVISANTDGVISLVHKDRLEEYNEVCKAWMDQTKFTLEFTTYLNPDIKDKGIYARANVNNYIAQDVDGKIKTKGCFQYDLTLHQGFDSPVVSHVLKKHLIDKMSVDEALLNHNDIYDFCIAQKMGSQFKAKWGGESIQKTCRFYVCKSGKKLRKYKEENGQRLYTNLASGKNVQMFNQYVEKPMSDYDIDYDYYKKEVIKILHELKKENEGLWKDEKTQSESNISSDMFTRDRKKSEPKKKLENESLW